MDLMTDHMNISIGMMEEQGRHGRHDMRRDDVRSAEQRSRTRLI